MPGDETGPARDAYWSALDAGRLQFQRCERCSNAWLPPRSECPRCWSPEWAWETATGDGRVVSWVVYHTAFDERFKTRLPYNVAVVELAEGPRLVTNLVEGFEHAGEVIDRPCTLTIERDLDRSLPRFRLT